MNSLIFVVAILLICLIVAGLFISHLLGLLTHQDELMEHMRRKYLFPGDDQE